jgi:O-succinylbenzoate synthase
VRDSVPAGVSVGIGSSIAQLLDTVGGFLAQGYQRIKLKIEPGWDVEAVAAVRERFGDIGLQVDANAAYRLSDARHLAELDAFGLILIEQPLPEEDLRGHAALARQMRTPICLDESIVSAAAAADAIALGACRIVNIKAGRVGGLLEAVRVHDVCAANGGVVRRHAGNRHRPGGERGTGRAAEFRPCR